MINERYSLEAFRNQTASLEGAEYLSEQLSIEIQKELHLVLSKKLEEIVGKLNSMGHCLTEYTTPVPGDISYRDSSNMKICNLRLGVDTVISVGFQDVEDP